jgi:kynurenine formamidase
MNFMKTIFYSFAVLLIIISSCTQPQQSMHNGQWIDLTHNFDEDAIYWPTAETFKFDTVFEGITEKGFYYSSFKFSAEEHGGTHIDAPRHFGEGKKSIHEIELSQLMGPAVVIDVAEQSANNRDYQVSVDDFLNWEAKHGTMPDQAMLMFNTGSAKYWPDREKYMGTAERGPEAVSKLHFPGLHPDAAKWLVENRNINLIGLDTPSIDYGQSVYFESHQVLFEDEILVIENVTNLDQLPPSGAWIVALPMKIKNGSGAPVRIVAWIPE